MTLSNLASTQWWTAVGTALLIWAILSDLFKKLVYAALAKVSSYYRQRREDSKATLEKHAALAAELPVLHSMWARDEARDRLVAVYYAILAVGSLSLYGISKVLTTFPDDRPTEWHLRASPDQVVAFIAYLIALGLFMNSSRNWGKASYNRKTLKKADKIIYQRSLKALNNMPTNPATETANSEQAELK